jgi:AraC-like DNA-binding protein
MDKNVVQTSKWEELAVRAGYKPSELARLTQVSLRTLQRHFRDHYNVTISEWLRTIRLREAYNRIKDGKSVKEVAYTLEYKQLSHFSREFKRMYDIAPSCLSGSTATKSSPKLKIGPSDTMPLRYMQQQN